MNENETFLTNEKNGMKGTKGTKQTDKRRGEEKTVMRIRLFLMSVNENAGNRQWTGAVFSMENGKPSSQSLE